MIDICFSDSTCGCLKVFLNFNGQKGVFDELADNKNVPKDIKHLIGIPSDEIISLWLDLQEFSIGKDDFESGRLEFLNRVYEEPADAKSVYDDYIQDINHIVEAAEKGESLRIWYSTVAYSVCGLYHIVNELKDTSANIIVVPLPHNDEYLTWASFDPWYMVDYVYNAHVATKEELENYASEWDRLCIENSVFRVNVDGIIKGVDCDYFDDVIYDVIYSVIDNKPIKMQEFVGKSLNRIAEQGNFVYIDFVVKRILNMVNKGFVEVVEKYPPQDFRGCPNWVVKKSQDGILN
jgi:hypothetical protein